ncbi:MAG: two-component system response regulator [Panacagrimonas sp.]
MNKPRILIVEDERIVALNLQRRLEKLGYDVVARAASGADALARARTTRPDLVLMDINIEGPIDGVEAAAQLLDELRIRVIYLTAYSEDSTLARARATEPYGYLLKPFSERELHSTLQMALQRTVADRAVPTRGVTPSQAPMDGGADAETPVMPSLRDLAAELVGETAARQSLRLSRLLDFVHDEDRAIVASAAIDAAERGVPCSMIFRQQRPGQPSRPLRIVARVAPDVNDAELRLLGVAQAADPDSTLASRVHWNASDANRSNDGLFVLDAQRRLVSANAAFTSLSGVESAFWIGCEVPFLTPESMTAAAHADLWKQVRLHGSWRGKLSVTTKAGEVVPACLWLHAVRDEPADEGLLIGILTPERPSHREDARRLLYDPLTGLPNRLVLQDRLEQAIRRAQRNNHRVALLLLDLEQDPHADGMALGDTVEREVASRIETSVRAADTSARLGKGGFAVMLENIPAGAPVVTVANKLSRALAKPLSVGGVPATVSTNIGIAMYPDDGRDATQLLQCAGSAVSEAKARGGNSYAFYNAGITARTTRYLERDQRLRRALQDHELRLHYQPQIDSATGRCVAVEALLRWNHPELGMLGAAEIVPPAEESGLIIDIGRWVLREACRQARAWRDARHAPIRVTVNTSPMEMTSGTLTTDVSVALSAARLEPDQLELEVTESALQTESLAVATLRKIRSSGVTVAIDDFGTGYSCLSSLKTLPLDRLKIDRSFVRELPADNRSAALVETILAIAGHMKLRVTAEGVETAEQASFLSARGCDDLQGWLYCPAVEPERIPALLDRWCHAK